MLGIFKRKKTEASGPPPARPVDLGAVRACFITTLVAIAVRSWGLVR